MHLFFSLSDSAPAYRPPGMRGREPKVQMHTYEPPSNQKNQPEQEKKQLSKNQKRKRAKVGNQLMCSINTLAVKYSYSTEI